jgi:D-beta-D-heptose 7-phosphate kinase/D-beta-D-heptose 1-phosphate adenosyltransferase
MTSSENMTELVSRMGNVRVLVIGDLMLDRFVYGDVERISPESPVPVLVVRRESRMLGGSGNVLANLHGLGVRAELLSVIGEDYEGDLLRGLVEAAGASGDHLIPLPEIPTTIKTRFLAGHQQLLRVDQERGTPFPKELETKIIESLTNLLVSQDALILSDYGKGVLTPTVLDLAISLAQEKGIPILVDPKGNDYKKYKGASVVTPNRKELSEAAGGLATSEDDDVVIAAETVIRASGIASVVATRSQDGMTILQQNTETGTFERPVHLRTRAQEVYDVSGAGDTVIATIAAALAAGANLVEAASLANIAAGIVVAKIGTASIRSRELQEAIKQQDSPREALRTGDAGTMARSCQAPVCDWEEAKEEIDRWRARGLKIGFTNGCFDILHAGHVNYLNKARKFCDRLVLGLNHDTSVHLLKGPTRPVNDQISRAAVLGALGAVDMVVFFGAQTQGEDNTAKTLIQLLQPDYYFKGADYTIDRIPEAGVVASYGGEVRLVPLTEGLSTTDIIAKIVKS